MNAYNPSSFRSSISAAFCAFVLSATCLTAALAPAQTATANTDSYSIVA